MSEKLKFVPLPMGVILDFPIRKTWKEEKKIEVVARIFHSLSKNETDKVIDRYKQMVQEEPLEFLDIGEGI